MNIQSIHIDTTNRCRVIAGPAGRTYFSTPQAVGLALLGIPAPTLDTEDTLAATTNIVWTDYLALNGVAIGQRGDRRVHLVVIPPKPRTVAYSWQDERNGPQQASLNVTFPHVLAGLLLQRNTFERGSLFLIDPAKQPQASAVSTVPMLMTFPYGNVHDISGAICWGGVRTADIRTMRDMEDLFFGSGFNRDLYRPTVGTGNFRTIAQAAPGGVLTPPPANHHTITIPSAVSHLIRSGE